MDWPAYGGNAAGDRYSTLTQINQSNVSELKTAWTYEAGVGNLETSPIVVDRTLYGYTTRQQVVALDAATGRPRWTFKSKDVEGLEVVRGLTYWTNGKLRYILASGGPYLYALDATSGAPVAKFGDGGRIDLRENLGRDPKSIALSLSTPGVIYKDLIIVGFRTSESKPSAPGTIRAYDVQSGRLRWTFRLIPKPGESGHATWPASAWKDAGGANVWAGMSVDEKRGIVYAATGSAVDDFYGADRAGNNLYANSLVALNAASGKRIWHFQAVHHDLWDWDLPAPPVLLTVRRDGRAIDAVAQTSKQGFVFLFDRETGTPLFPIEERAVPQSDVPGEKTSPTQPFSLKPAPFARQTLTKDMVTKRTPKAREKALQDFASFRNEGMFTPLTVGRRTVVFPGFDGGAEWGGAAVDRSKGVIYVNSNDIVWLGELSQRTENPHATPGQALYERHCAVCHGADRKGSPPDFPSLIDVASRRSSSQIVNLIRGGQGRMPAFPQFEEDDISAVIAYISGTSHEQVPSDRSVSHSAPSGDGEPAYAFTGYKKWLDDDGYPAVAPPWGTLNAIDLNTGEYLWKIPLGEYPELSAQGIPVTGTENYGGPIVTAGGLVFIGATIYDRKFRAFDSRTGKLLWEEPLPFSAVATPITYMIDGQQYLVVACSGGRNPKGPQGSAYVAFSLSQRSSISDSTQSQ